MIEPFGIQNSVWAVHLYYLVPHISECNGEVAMGGGGSTGEGKRGVAVQDF